MSQFGNFYSQYYDLLYQDKDYSSEVDYINDLIIQFSNNAKTILDMGCGTGRHAELFYDKGYTVHGIDLSEDMLTIAETRCAGKEDRLSFSNGNVVDLKLNKKFDIVVSLFHVMSYQNSNEDLIKAFEVAREHLNKDGIFVFDFWYGPAVLTDLPVTRVKRLKDENITVTRVSEPSMHVQENIVDVKFEIFIEDNNSKKIIKKSELHKMRYLFDTELKMICKKTGFDILSKRSWLSNEKPNFDSWNVVWVVKKL